MFVPSSDPLIRSSSLRILQRIVSVRNFGSVSATLLLLSRQFPEGAPDFVDSLLGVAEKYVYKHY